MKVINRFFSALFGFQLLALWAGSSMAGVVGSQHDLTTGGQGQGQTANTDEVCVFCHTPHGSDVNAPVPLWNKVLGAPGSYTPT